MSGARRRHHAGPLPSLGPTLLALAEVDLLAPTVEASPNNGPRIQEYLAAVGKHAPADWGPAAVSAWALWAATERGLPPLIGGSDDGATVIRQLVATSRWVDRPKLALKVVRPGMIAGFRVMLAPSVTKRRVGVVRSVSPSGAMEVIFGNAGPANDRVFAEVKQFSDPLFVGVGGL